MGQFSAIRGTVSIRPSSETDTRGRKGHHKRMPNSDEAFSRIVIDAMYAMILSKRRIPESRRKQ